MFSKDFVPAKPFPDFKWKWACLQCTEGINDPVILLGVLFRMKKLEGRGLKYSSQCKFRVIKSTCTEFPVHLHG